MAAKNGIWHTEIRVQGTGEFPWRQLPLYGMFPRTQVDVEKCRQVRGGVRSILFDRYSKAGTKLPAHIFKAIGWEILSDTGKGVGHAV